jgi:hypothetical protein
MTKLAAIFQEHPSVTLRTKLMKLLAMLIHNVKEDRNFHVILV